MATPRRLVPQAFLEDAERERYGLDLALDAGLEPGAIYPILVAFEGRRLAFQPRGGSGRPR